MNDQNEIVLYQPNELTKLEVRIADETVWLTQAQMAELFGKDQSVIARHIHNAFIENEIDGDLLIANQIEYFNILSKRRKVATLGFLYLAFL